MVTLVKKINGTFKSKLKTRTPVVIGISKSDLEILKKIPKDCLAKLQSGEGTEKDWFNVMFRIRIGYETALPIYTQDAVEAFEEIQETCMDILLRYKNTDKWTVTEQEALTITLGFHAVEQMLIENTRRVMLDIFKSSDRYVVKIMKEFKSQSE